MYPHNGPGQAGPAGALRPLAAALALTFATLPLAQTFVVPGVSVADLALALLLAAVALHWARQPPHLAVPVWFWPAALLLVWSGAGGIALASGSPLPFSVLEWAKSFAKLAFYLAGAGAVAVAATSVGADRWREALRWALALHAVVAFYVYTAMHWGLPFRFLWAGSQGSAMSTYTLRFSQPFVRLRGMAAEPAYLGYFLALGLAAVMLSAPASPRRPWRELLAAVALVLTFSLSTYALAATAVVLLLWRHRRAMARARPFTAVKVALALLLLLILSPLHPGFTSGIVERTAELVVDGATSVELKRIVGSWSAAHAMARESPLLGVGLGNYDVALENVVDRLDSRLRMGGGEQGWNVLAYGLACLGWIGLLLLLWLLLAGARASPAGALLMLVATFADGTLLGASFWTFYVLLTLPSDGTLPAPAAVPIDDRSTHDTTRPATRSGQTIAILHRRS